MSAENKKKKVSFELNLEEDKKKNSNKKSSKNIEKKNSGNNKTSAQKNIKDIVEIPIIEDEELVVEEVKIKKKLGLTNIILIILIMVLLFLLGYYYLLLPSVKLIGSNNVVLEYESTYKEKGFEATHFGKDITDKVKVYDNINHNKLGKYKVTYSVESNGLSKSVVRNVSIVDTKKPVMNIDSSDSYVCPGDEYIKEEVIATDNYDGDISDKVSVDISKEKDKVIYSIKDTSGNKESITKKIIYKDVESPVIKLNGSEIIYTFLGEGFNDPLYTVIDNCDGDFTGKVSTNGSVDINTVGEYNIEYIAKDNAGNSSSVSRKVFVNKRDAVGTIYLTFDDGPKEGTTNVILDILKEEGVEATFFVTNSGPDYLIKRMYDEGHTVALHTATHDYQKVYSSVEGYYNDLYSVQERVKRITGYESKIIRFPGGSSNTVSKKYSVGIMSTLTQDVVNRGYKYYDWNLSSGDAAGGSPSSTTIYNNVVYNLRKDKVNMVLMHDIKTYTRDALRDIIRYGKNNGYTFEKITMDTNMIKQKVNN